jgi:hypothetical protein
LRWTLCKIDSSNIRTWTFIWRYFAIRSMIIGHSVVASLIFYLIILEFWNLCLL